LDLVINTSVFIAAAKELVLHHDSKWLKENGGHLELSTYWAKKKVKKTWIFREKSHNKG